MATNEIFGRGEFVTATVSGGSDINSGAPVVVGQIPGVAVTDGTSANLVTFTTVGIYDLPVQAMNAGSTSAVAVGDILYYFSGSTPNSGSLTKGTGGVRFGYAWEALTTAAGSAAPVTRQVKVGY